MSSAINIPEYNVPQLVVSLACYSVALIISTSISIVELTTRRRIKSDRHLKELNTTLNNNSLRLSSLFALFSCQIFSIFALIGHIPISATCTWGIIGVQLLFWFLIQIFFTFYQMARLKYCFSTRNSAKYGYSNGLFIILTLYGIIITIYSIFIVFYIKDASKPFGLLCITRHYKYSQEMVAIWSGLFYIWDWTVLLLYVIKLCQFQRMRHQMDIVHKKVFFILQKILLLTIIYEISGMIALFISGFTRTDVLSNICLTVSVSISSFIIFLMIEHNNDHYIKMVNILNSCCLCCCCKSLIKDVIEHEMENAVGDSPPPGKEAYQGSDNMDDISNLDTGNISSQYQEKQTYMMESEITVTNISKPV